MIGKGLASLIYMFKPKREPDVLIGPTKEDPYMRRWWVIPRNKHFNVYLHHMRHDDDDRAAHDHPWWSISLCLKGYILEKEYHPESKTYTDNHIRKGNFKYRSSSYAHRLVLPEGDAWTLFITGSRKRDWGFYCPKKWVFWKDFVDPNNPGQPGRGCGKND